MIEVSLTGDTAPNAAPNLRGFVGIAFRVANQGARYECFTICAFPRMAARTISFNATTPPSTSPVCPIHPGKSCEPESPGKYGPYVDLVPGAWTR